jgi:hypothetical protein
MAMPCQNQRIKRDINRQKSELLKHATRDNILNMMHINRVHDRQKIFIDMLSVEITN